MVFGNFVKNGEYWIWLVCYGYRLNVLDPAEIKLAHLV